MKNFILTLLILLIPYTLSAQVSKNNPTKKIGFSLYGGANIPVNGNISQEVKTTDFLYTGPQYGFGVSYYFSKAVGVELNTTYNLNFNQKEFKLDGKHSSVYTYTFSLNGIYNLGYLIKKTNLSPYVKGGIGIYRWKHLDDAPWDDPSVVDVSGYEFKASSFGFNIGAGLDYSVSKYFSVGLLLDYNIYFPKDEDKFGKDFGAQGNLTPQFKLSYYLPIH